MDAKQPILESSSPCGAQEHCPLCGRDNACQVAKGDLYKGPCWCQQIVVPEALLRRLAEKFTCSSCLCQACLETLARLAREGHDTEAILEQARTLVATNLSDIPAEPDFYLDEFGNTVFTAAYHLKRGKCCGNQCRHCPY